MQVRPDPHFRPRDIKSLNFPVDDAIMKFNLPIYQSLLEVLRPIKAQYEQGLYYDMRRYRVFEPEIPASIALRNKRRKRAKQTELTVSCSRNLQCQASQPNDKGTASRLLHCACARSSRCSLSSCRGDDLPHVSAEGAGRGTALLRSNIRAGARGGVGEKSGE